MTEQEIADLERRTMEEIESIKRECERRMQPFMETLIRLQAMKPTRTVLVIMPDGSIQPTTFKPPRLDS